MNSIELRSIKRRSQFSSGCLSRFLGNHYGRCLNGDTDHERKSNAGCKRIDPLILFKMLVLQELFNLSDEGLEFQVNDEQPIEEFFGLGVMNNIRNATTIAFFRERLRKASVIEELFEMFETYLRSKGLQARGGQIIDAPLIPGPIRSLSQ